jgi:predicted HTH transcriptional regulator
MRDVHELLEGREGPRLDFKRDLSSMAKVVRTLAAMGNTAGGHVVVGVDDDRTVPGLTDPLKDEEALSRAIADSIEPLLPVEIFVQHVGAVNRAIVRILRELHLMEILGSGYERISTTFDDGYPEPDWRELGVVVRVTTPTHPFFVEGDDGDREGDGSDEGDHLVDGRSMSAEQRAAWVLAKIDAGPPVTNQYLARTLGVSLATVERLTSRMQQDGTIRRSGTRRSGRFQRT